MEIRAQFMPFSSFVHIFPHPAFGFFFCLLVSASASSGLDSTAREVGNFPGLSLVLDFLHFLQNLLFCFPFAHSKVMWLRETTENDSLKKNKYFYICFIY